MEIKNSSILIKNIRLVFRCSLQKSIQFSTITTVNNYVALIILLLTEQFCKVTDLLNCLTLLSHRESFHDWLRAKNNHAVWSLRGIPELPRVYAFPGAALRQSESEKVTSLAIHEPIRKEGIKRYQLKST